MRILTVAELSDYIGTLLDADDLLRDVWVLGEISNPTRASSGHWYWTMKGESGQLDAACFQRNASRLTTTPTHGAQVLAHGEVRFYAARSKVQLYVDFLRPAGVGLLHARFEELRSRLEAEGLFDPGRKRPIPAMPRRIGVVTSPTGAAFRDICNVLSRRYPLAEVILAPSLVQGDAAPEAIVTALATLYSMELDVILVARGGGSLEDLWAFNEELVARAIYASPVPVISGVGHETDTTIADYVADLRAPTPSAAAELVAPDLLSLRMAVGGMAQVLTGTFMAQLAELRADVERLEHQIERRSPQSVLRQQRQRVDEIAGRLRAGLDRRIALQRAQLTGLGHKLEALSPTATLARGYAAVTSADGALITGPAQVHPGDTLNVRLRDGSLTVQALAEKKKRGRG